MGLPTSVLSLVSDSMSLTEVEVSQVVSVRFVKVKVRLRQGSYPSRFVSFKVRLAKVRLRQALSPTRFVSDKLNDEVVSAKVRLRQGLSPTS